MNIPKLTKRPFNENYETLKKNTDKIAIPLMVIYRFNVTPTKCQ